MCKDFSQYLNSVIVINWTGQIKCQQENVKFHFIIKCMSRICSFICMTCWKLILCLEHYNVTFGELNIWKVGALLYIFEDHTTQNIKLLLLNTKNCKYDVLVLIFDIFDSQNSSFEIVNWIHDMQIDSSILFVKFVDFSQIKNCKLIPLIFRSIKNLGENLYQIKLGEHKWKTSVLRMAPSRC